MSTSSRPETLPDLVQAAWLRHPGHRYGCKVDGAWQTWTTDQMASRVQALAAALRRAGVEPGTRVGIVARTRIEWTLTEYATLWLGAVVVPVYPSLPAEQLGWILDHAGVRVLFIDGAEEWAKVVEIRDKLPQLTTVVSFDPVAAGGAGSPPIEFSAFAGSGDLAAGAVVQAVAQADALASIIYTSGTTGEPKGVALSHRNIVANVLACTEVCPFSKDDRQLCFLPLSHIFERMVHYYMLWNDVTIYFAEDITKVIDNLVEVQPTVLTSVPRVLEKVLAKVEDSAGRGGLTGWLAGTGIETARATARARHGVGGTGAGASLQYRLLDRLVFQKIRAKLGGRVRVIVTGGAATPTHVTEFFTGIGIRVLPGYGLTEHSPVIAFNTIRDFRFGTVGKPIPGTEVKIAADGEILARGPSVMLGYYRNDDQTRAVIDDDGYLATGDIGELDGDGFLMITDRKKDLIVTSQGKNVAPQPIEQVLVQDAYISQAMLIGDGRPYIAALLVPRLPALVDWASERGIDVADAGRLVTHPEVVALYQSRVEALCGRFARHESVKRVALLERELTEADGELTPTLKIKRRVIAVRYAEVIEGLYA